MEKPFYVLNTSHMFPLDVTLGENPTQVLRTELVSNYSVPLPPSSSLSNQNSSLASTFLTKSIIPHLIKLFDTLKLTPISMSDQLHKHGLGVRYLAHVLVNSRVTHIREQCASEMVARTVKNVLGE